MVGEVIDTAIGAGVNRSKARFGFWTSSHANPAWRTLLRKLDEKEALARAAGVTLGASVITEQNTS